jgi:hypothetical protein
MYAGKLILNNDMLMSKILYKFGGLMTQSCMAIKDAIETNEIICESNWEKQPEWRKLFNYEEYKNNVVLVDNKYTRLCIKTKDCDLDYDLQLRHNPFSYGKNHDNLMYYQFKFYLNNLDEIGEGEIAYMFYEGFLE